MLRRVLTNAMLFYPTRGQWRTPSDVGLAYEEVAITAADGVRTQGWWIPSSGRQALLYFHGNAGTIADRLEFVVALRRLGVSVLMAEYRGYGDSQGRPSERGFRADAVAALASLERLAPDRQLIAFGRSLGGAVAIDLASRREVAGLVVESTFTSLADIARSATGIPLVGRLCAYRFDSRAKISSVRAPMLIIHGDSDELVPPAMGEGLRDAAAERERVSFHMVRGGRHNDTWLRGGRPYWAAWSNFLTSV